jgi:hypothetical protein
MAPIIPRFSASGINTPGGIIPFCGSIHRISASTPAIRPVLRLMRQYFKGVRIQLGAEELVGMPPLFLGAACSRTGGFQERFRIVTIPGVVADPDAGRQLCAMPGQGERFCHFRYDFLRQCRRVLYVADIIQNQSELVPADTREKIRGSYGGAKPCGGITHQPITESIAQQVVDDPEAVKIDGHDGDD